MIAEQLKKSILQAAIQGKLTEQLPEDGDARDLLKEIQKEKARLVKEGKIRKEKPLPEITEDEIPFEIPDNWCWVRLGELANYKKGPFGSSLTKGMFIPDGSNAIKVYEQKNAIQKNIELGNYYIVNDYYHESMKGFTVFGGDIIISCAGTIGEAYILPDDSRIGIINQALMRVRVFNGLDKLLFLELFNYAINTKIAQGKGSAIKNIPPFETLKNIVVPLPALREQKRIVERLKEFLSEIDKLKSDETKLEDLQKSFPKKMKDAILQYAIQGKLTEQLPDDGDARDLLKEIQKEKARLLKEGKIKKGKPLHEITEDEIPFEIPENWCWVRFGDIFSIGSARRVHQRDWRSSGVPFYRAREIAKLSEQDYVDNELFIENAYYDKLKSESGVPKVGDLMVTGVGTLGKTYIVKEEDKFYYKDASVLCVSNYGNINPEYFKFFMESQIMMDQINSNSSGTTVGTLTISRYDNYLFSLPTISEQERIVERIEALLTLCKTLE